MNVRMSMLLTVAFAATAGCKAIDAKNVTITSDPPGASLSRNGVNYGIAGLMSEFSFDQDEEYTIVARLDGYEDASTVITYEPKNLTSYHLTLQKVVTVIVPLVTVEPTRTLSGAPELKITRLPTLAYLDTMERSPSVPSVTQVTSNHDRWSQIGSLMLAPDADVVIYNEIIDEEDGSLYSNIFQQTSGSAVKTRITYGKWLDLSPCFTPDGQHVVFSSNRMSDNPTLWRVRILGEGGITKITDSLALDFSPSLSPDGKKIAYASLPPAAEELQVWTIEAGGRYPTQLCVGHEPRISPDGTRIVFVREVGESGRRTIWLMDVGGGSETQITPSLDYDATDPRWSPEGDWITYASDEGLDSDKNHNFDIWVIRPDLSGKTQLTTNGSRDDSPCWDSTGTYIYFRSNRGGFWNIWRLHPRL